MTDTAPNELVHTLDTPGPNPTLEGFFQVALRFALNKIPSDVWVEAWIIMATLENSKAAWNPADTTYPEEGATPYNSFGPGGQYHVWDYVSAEQGISAFLKTLDGSDMAPLKRAMFDETITLPQALAAIATSPWTGITGDPHLYDGVHPDGGKMVEGANGWPYAIPSEPVPENPDRGPETPVVQPETEEQKVDSALHAQTTEVEAAAEAGKVSRVRELVAALKVHLAELEDLTK